MSDRNREIGKKAKKARGRIKSEGVHSLAEDQTEIDKTYRSGLTYPKIDQSIKQMDNAALMESISCERKRLNEIAKKALEYDGNLDAESVREQNRVVESLINEALLRRLEGLDEQE